MKKILSMALTLSMLLSAFPGRVASAEDTTTSLNEIFSFDMSSTSYEEFKTRYQLYHGSSKELGSRIAETASDLGAVYGIGDYYTCLTSVAIPLGTETNTNGQIDGVKKTGTPNQYIEAEFDYAVKDYIYSTNTSGAVGATFVTYADTTGDTLINPAYNYGSFYHRYNEDGTVQFFRTAGSTEITAVTPTANKWYRVKLVSQLTDADGNFKSSGNATHVYIDGVKVASYAYKATAVNNTNEYISFFRLHQSNGRSCLDNLSVRTYQAGDAPVEKGELIAAIRDFLSTYTNYTDYEEAVTYIDSAKAVYKNASATQDDVTAALADIESAINVVNPKPQTYFEYDFETDDNLTAFYNAAGIASAKSRVTVNEDTDKYGIGKYVKYNSGDVYVAIDPAISRSASENMYLELEMDIKPEEPSASNLAATDTNRSAVYLTTTKSASDVGAGIECNYEHPTYSENNECLTIPYKESVKLKEFKYGEWYRCKIVCLLNDNGSTSNTDGLVKYYIDGDYVGQSSYNSSKFTDAAYVRFYGGYANLSVDNLSVKTYKADNPAADKAGLISKIRSFIKYYPEYTENSEALAFFNQAAAIYNSDDIEAEDITTAENYLAQAQRVLFNAEPLINENFNSCPDSFFDTADAEGSYVNESIYMIDNALSMPASTAVKNFEAVALGGDCAYMTADCDVKVDGSAEIKLADSISYTLESDGTNYNRVRFDIDTQAKTYDVYVNGEKKVTAQEITDTEISAFTASSESEYTIDNITVYSFENAEDVVADKGALVTALRAAKALLDAGTMTNDETELMETVFDKYAYTYEAPVVSNADIEKATERILFYNENLSAQMDGAQSVVIPGMGKDLTDTQVHLNLHYGSQQGNEAYDDIFFDTLVSKDFSNVRFYNTDGDAIQSHINSTGNYEFIEDDNLPRTRMLKTQDGKVVAKRNGKVQISSDMGETWDDLGSGFKTENVYMVDKDNNIWHFRDDASVDGPAEIYKIYAPDYTEEKLMIDTSQLWGLYNNWDSSNVDEDYNVEDAHFTMNYDDDGYVYVGLYQTEWTGCTVYVSDSNGENFVVADFRPDKQHVHSISVNRHVYPNEVYIGMDDSLRKPLCYVTTDHLGYEDIKDDPDHQLPCQARSTGGMELFLSTDDEHPDKYMPKNDIALKILEHSKQHVTQVPVPFGNPDYMGRCIELIEDMDAAPEKFEYNEEMGKWYTIKNREYKNEINGKIHYYSDNVYGIGFGEANILGGPGAYKTTDIMNPDAYYSVVKTTHGARRTVRPANGILLWGGLSGGYAQNASLAISYDDGETWTEAYTYGYDFSLDAGNGAFRYMDGPWEQSDGTTQMLMYGYGNQPSMRGIFGGDNYFALSSVLLPELPEDGIKIFVNTDGEVKQPVTKYYYGTADETAVIKSVKTSEGESEVLKFPLTGNGTNVVYRYDIATDSDTAVEANLMASTNKGVKSVAKMFFNTADGTVSLNDETAIANDAVASGSFSVKFVTDADGTGKLYIDNVYVGETALAYEYKNLTALTYKTVDVSGTVPSISTPVTIYYSNVSYGEYSTEDAQFLLEDLVMEKDGARVDEVTAETQIKSAAISQIDEAVDGAVLITALYNDGVLEKTKFIDVTGSGTYDIDMTAEKDNLEVKCFLFKDMKTILPLKLENITDMGTDVGFDLSGISDTELVTVKESNTKPFSEKAAATELACYINNDIVTPVFRMKFDEGTGNTVTESISDTEYTIEGDGYEWVNDAEIRYGTATPLSIRQHSALRLNDSYINLGNVEALAGIDDEFTVSFWTNFEIAGRDDDYEEPAHHVLSGTKTYGTMATAYKYDRTRKNVIFTSDTAKMALTPSEKYMDMSFNGITTNKARMPMPAVETDFYNMYTLIVKKNDDGTWTARTYGNDKPAATNSGITLDNIEIFDGNLYIGTPSADGEFGSMQLGIADLMVFDKALSYQERLELYYGYRQAEYFCEEALAY